MPHQLNARELRQIKEMYSLMIEAELLQLKPDFLVPEAQAILASELLSRGWDQPRIDAHRTGLREQLQEATTTPEPRSSESSIPGHPLIWGLLSTLMLISAVAMEEESLRWMLMFASISSIFAGLAKKANEGQRKREQVTKDSDAVTIQSSLSARESEATTDESPPLQHRALFLRPFSVTRRLSVRNPYQSMGPLWPSAIAESSEIDIETLLSDVFRPETPLVCLGKPGEAIGAARIETLEETWQLEFMKLAHSTELILVIPAASKGTKWEIAYLKEQALLGKCIFVMPASDLRNVAVEWQLSAKELPIEMPKYSKYGMLYVVNDDGFVRAGVKLTAPNRRVLVSRIEQVARINVRHLLTSDLSDLTSVRFVGVIAFQVLLYPFFLFVIVMALINILGSAHC